VLQAFPGFRLQRISFQAWLFRIARNLSVDYYRRNENRLLPLEETLTDTTQNVPAHIDHQLTSESLKQALNRLSDEQRDVVILRFVACMPIRETAQTLKKSEDAIKGQQRRALSNLKDILADQEVHYV
jgi:RNA polymerase sigma-70 factor (ECF subfamily)